MTQTPSVRLVTAAQLPRLAPDDQELLHALHRRGVTTEVSVWDDPTVDWASSAVTVIRSVFDYHLRRDEFIAWLDRIETFTCVQNSPDIIRWNSHKSYLRRVADAGFPTIPTVWAQQGSTVDIAAVLETSAWAEGVVKPAVSASAYGALKVTRRNLIEGQTHLDSLLRRGDALIQPYLPDFETTGETSVIWLGDEQTHSVRRPSGMHTTLEEAHLGEPLAPTPEETRFAHSVYQWIRPSPLYARIDLLRTRQYGLLVLELELIEPALYLRHSTRVADHFASAIHNLLRANRNTPAATSS